MKNWKDKVLGIFAGIGIMSLLMATNSQQPNLNYGVPESFIWEFHTRRYERGGKAGDNYFTAGEFAWRRTQEFRLSLQYRINQNKRRGGQRGNYDPSEFQGGSGIFGN